VINAITIAARNLPARTFVNLIPFQKRESAPVLPKLIRSLLLRRWLLLLRRALYEPEKEESIKTVV
jgi:hypothetical protein